MHVSLHASEKHSLPPRDVYGDMCQARRSSALARGEDGARTKGHGIHYIQGGAGGHPAGAHTEGDRMAKQSPRYTEKEIWRRKS